ncbi:MAG TPA: hypothetical protein VII61_00755 [Ktedonobacteraceae bacterium]|jgi:hypothetical protein
MTSQPIHLSHRHFFTDHSSYLNGIGATPYATMETAEGSMGSDASMVLPFQLMIAASSGSQHACL